MNVQALPWQKLRYELLCCALRCFLSRTLEFLAGGSNGPPQYRGCACRKPKYDFNDQHESKAGSSISEEVSCPLLLSPQPTQIIQSFRFISAKMRLLAPILLSISTIAATYPTVSHTTHEKRNTSLIAWKKDSRASKAEVLPVRIGLTQRNLEHGDRFLHDISDPDSPNFGNIYSCSSSISITHTLSRKALDS
jgi:hypothetical protein